MRCPFCDSKRVVKFLHGINAPRPAYQCKKCGKHFTVTVAEIEPYTCSKCKKPIYSVPVVMGSGKVKHSRCRGKG